MADKPNVLFILSDQHNAKFLGCTGLTDVQTPNLDRMAAEGVRFQNALCPTIICTPSRVSYLSAQYCHNHGRYGFGGQKPEHLPTILGHFRNAGYRTAAVGKIHCPGTWVPDDCDEFYETDRTTVGGSCKEYLDYMAQRGINIYDEYSLPGQGCPSPFRYEDSQEGWSARKVMDIIDRAAKDRKPFFIHLSLTKPHEPYTPAKRFWDLYGGRTLRLPPNADYDLVAARKAPYQIDIANNVRKSPTFQKDRLDKLQGYLGNVTQCDYAVGEILKYLDDARLAADTIIAYTADHGDYAVEHGPNEKVPGIAADAVVRVPMLWRWPGRFKPGHVATEIVEGIDVPYTLCALAGLPRMDTADGKDLTPLLNGGRGELRTIGVTENVFSRSVRKGKWRLVYYPPRFFGAPCPFFGELYDLEADPWEMKNLYFDPHHAPVIREIERDLLDWLVTTTRPGNAPTSRSMNPADGKVHPDELWAGLPGGAYS